MKREIFEVTAKVIDANGTYNTLSGYPKAFDSKNYNNDVKKTEQRALGEYYSALGSMCSRDDRLEQLAYVVRMSDGIQIALGVFGKMPEVADQTE